MTVSLHSSTMNAVETFSVSFAMLTVAVDIVSSALELNVSYSSVLELCSVLS
jgi:hypothetical protein